MVEQLSFCSLASALAAPGGLAKLKAALVGGAGQVPSGRTGLSFSALLRTEGHATPQGTQGQSPGHPKRALDEPAPETHRHAGETALDPVARHAAQLAPPLAHEPAAPLQPLTSALAPAAPEVRARASLEDLLPALVRKVAWSGDGRRGAVRLELGAGALSGATLLVQTDEGRVRVQLNAPAGADVESWRARIAQRLAARGLAVDSVEVE